MPRESYAYLTDATKEVLTDNVKAMAAGWDKCKEYIYQILRDEKDDFFAPFAAMYEGACRGGVSTAGWDRELAFLRQKHSKETKTREASEAFKDKFHGQNVLFERYLAMIADGRLDIAECRDLEGLIDIEEKLMATLKTALRDHRAKLEKIEVN